MFFGVLCPSTVFWGVICIKQRVVLKPGMEQNGMKPIRTRQSKKLVFKQFYGTFNCHTVTIIVPEFTHKHPRDHLYQSSI